MLLKNHTYPAAPGQEEVDRVICASQAQDSSNVYATMEAIRDRALSHKRPDALVVAMVFPEEIYDAAERPIPHEPHDVPVDAIATPSGWTAIAATSQV